MLISIKTKNKYPSDKTTDRLKIKVKVKHTIYSLHMTSPTPFDNNGRGKI